MSKTKKLREADRHITRAECQALIVHTLNEVFGKLAAPTIREIPADFDCPHCHGSQLVHGSEDGPASSCVCTTGQFDGYTYQDVNPSDVTPMQHDEAA